MGLTCTTPLNLDSAHSTFHRPDATFSPPPYIVARFSNIVFLIGKRVVDCTKKGSALLCRLEEIWSYTASSELRSVRIISCFNLSLTD
jgi:hypothetical protein